MSGKYKLRDVRIRRGLRLRRVARDLGIWPNRLSRIERGMSAGREEIKRALADYYGLPVGYLFYGESEPNQGSDETEHALAE